MIKRNSREFKDLKSALEEYAGKRTRKRYIVLYSQPAGDGPDKMVVISKHDRSGVAYDLTMESVLSYFNDSRKKLFREDKSGMYYFKGSERSPYIEFPFELKGEMKKKIFPLERIK